MVKNQIRYERTSEKAKKQILRNMTSEERIKKMEELLSIHNLIPPRKRKDPLPLSINKLLDPKYKTNK